MTATNETLRKVVKSRELLCDFMFFASNQREHHLHKIIEARDLLRETEEILINELVPKRTLNES